MIRSLACLALLAGPVAAQTLSFPGNATRTEAVDLGFDTLALATGPWTDGHVPKLPIEGDVRQEAWRIDAAGLTTLQMLRPLREQLANAGFDTVYECDTEDCGGFDFRFDMLVMLPPSMQVNLGDFRYLAALKADDGTAQAVALIVSRTPTEGFVQVMTVGEAPKIDATAPSVRSASQQEASVSEALTEGGRAVLTGLEFRTGSSQLTAGEVPSLMQLADYLAANTDRRIALVGHTDAEGSLAANIALSKQRAGAVLERLVTEYGAARRQLVAEGNGYLSPVASNLTPEGRESNRRVEAIVLN